MRTPLKHSKYLEKKNTVDSGYLDQNLPFAVLRIWVKFETFIGAKIGRWRRDGWHWVLKIIKCFGDFNHIAFIDNSLFLFKL